MAKNLMSDNSPDFFLDYVVPAVTFLRDLLAGLGLLALIIWFGWHK